MIEVVVRELDVPQALFGLAAVVAALGVPSIIAAYRSGKNAHKIDAIGEQAAQAARAAVTEAELPDSNGATLGETVEQMGKTVAVIQVDVDQVKQAVTSQRSNYQRIEGKVDEALAVVEEVKAETAPLADWVRRAMTATRHGRRASDKPDELG
ncbi:MAG: hypothetical protein M3P43_13320 [Actinomycetota bacterium]|nr:hypothetical protein [Actinomycetota bacterium]